MNYKTLGKTGEQLSAIGLGCMGMSFAYGQADEQESIRTLHKALIPVLISGILQICMRMVK